MAPSPGHDIPQIAGIDQAELLERIGGDEDLYWELLCELSRGYRDFPQRIADGLDTDVEEASRLAHTLKGVFGNLAVTDLHILCRDLHDAIREGQSTRWPALMEALSVEFPTLCDAIDIAAEAAAGDRSGTAVTPGDRLRERYAALADALRGNRARDCKSLVKEIAASDMSPDELGHFEAIKQLVLAYQFKDALVLVEDRLHE